MALSVSGVQAAGLLKPGVREPAQRELQVEEAFQKFVAGSFFRQMLKSLRSTVGKPPYFHGGQAEEVFRSQLDEQLADELAESHGAAISAPLYESFRLLTGRAAEGGGGGAAENRLDVSV
jgi:Rod binding domain-containing protein